MTNPGEAASWSSAGTVQVIAVLAVIAALSLIAFMVKAFISSNKELNANFDKALEQNAKIHLETREDHKASLKVMTDRFSVYDSQHAAIEERHERRDRETIGVMREIAEGVAQANKRA